MKILLHICCGPCATACIERLKSEGHEITLLFSNANIAPTSEYIRRLEAAQTLAQITNTPLIIDDTVTHQEWLTTVATGYEYEKEGGARCRRCFEFNLTRAKKYLDTLNLDGFTTSLTISPHKRSSLVFEAGLSAGGPLFLPFDFKKKDGFKRSLILSKEYNLYRQSYCGCEFSLPK